MCKKIDDYLEDARDAWLSAQDICPDRDLKADENDPGSGLHCGNEENESGMAWCELSSCPRVQLYR